MRRLAVLPLVLLGVFMVAACGGSSGASGSAGSAGVAAPNQTVTLHETEFKLDPAAVNVKAGTITFKLVDDGKAPHDLHVAPHGSSNELGASERMSPGGSATLTVTLQPGVYDMWCGIDGHRQLGMQGTINVA